MGKILSAVLVVTMAFVGCFAGNVTTAIAASSNSSNATAEDSFVFNSSTGTITGYTGSDIEVIIPYSIGEVRVTSIGDSAFKGCSSLTRITIPYSVTNIDNYAFYGCSGLTGITIPFSVTSIGSQAFYGCSGLTRITIPGSVTNIGYSPFYGCSKLKTAGSIGGGYDYEFGWTETIPSHAFDGCSGLTSISLPPSVTNIGGAAFNDCSSLTDITIPDSVISIGNVAFWGCTSLTDITIPNNVTDIGDYAFSECSSLTGITIPDSVTNIGGGAFSGCSSLTGITLSNSLTNIDGSAFRDCSGLTDINIPHSVTNIGSYAFSKCSSLTGITIPDSVTNIGDSAFRDCSGLTDITIPHSVTNIGSYAFSKCSSLTGIIIPDSVTNIDNGAFSLCSGLTSITIPDSVTNIGIDAFGNCSSLTSITIPDSVTTIGSSAFRYTGLGTVYCYDGSTADNISLYPSGAVISHISEINKLLNNSPKNIDVEEVISGWGINKGADGTYSATVNTTSGTAKLMLTINQPCVLYYEMGVADAANAGLFTLAKNGTVITDLSNEENNTADKPYCGCIILEAGDDLYWKCSKGSLKSTTDVGAFIKNLRTTAVGDANLDGKVDILDAISSQKFTDDVDLLSKGAVDTNSNGSVETAEVAAILRKVIENIA